MRSTVMTILMVNGAFFMLVAALGLVRMPDLFMRLSATTKASTLGASSLLLAAAIYFNDLRTAAQVMVIIGFIVLTAPVAAHMLGRAAYFNKIPLWKGTLMDELRERFESEIEGGSGRKRKKSKKNPEL